MGNERYHACIGSLLYIIIVVIVKVAG